MKFGIILHHNYTQKVCMISYVFRKLQTRGPHQSKLPQLNVKLYLEKGTK